MMVKRGWRIFVVLLGRRFGKCLLFFFCSSIFLFGGVGFFSFGGVWLRNFDELGGQ